MRLRVGYELVYRVSAANADVADAEHALTRARRTCSCRITSIPIRSSRCGNISDSFGNLCTRLTAPPGVLTLSARGVFEVPPHHELPEPNGYQHMHRRAARRVHAVPARQPLLRDRPAVERRVADVRPHAARTRSRAGDLQLRAQPYPLRLQLRAADQDRLGNLEGRRGRLPRLRASGRRAVPRDEHSGALLHGLHQRRRACRRPMRRWTSARGSRRISATRGIRSTRATTRRAPDAS